MNELLEERRLKQVEAGRVLGVPQSKVSALANYRARPAFAIVAGEIVAADLELSYPVT